MTTLTETSVAGNDDRRENNRNNTNTAAHKLMVALDVDGTLVDHDGHMSVPVREAAQDVVAAGHHVTIATGRSLNATLPIIEHIGIENGYAVCSNGGVTLRLDPSLPDGYEIVHKATFDPGPALRALRRAGRWGNLGNVFTWVPLKIRSGRKRARRFRRQLRCWIQAVSWAGAACCRTGPFGPWPI